MKVIDEQKHFLALMVRPGDYIYIDIAKLDIANGYVASSLDNIDSFTMHFTKEEIKESVIRGNLASNYYTNGKLVIQDNQKHNPLEVIDKEYYNNFRIDLYLKEVLNDKVKTNTILNKFRSICKDNNIYNAYARAIKNGNIDIVVDILFNLPYLELRKYIIYLIELRNKDLEKEKSKERIRDKAA